MKRFILLSLVVFVVLVIFVPNSVSPWEHSGEVNPRDRASGPEEVWQVFHGLITAIRDALYLLAELTLDLLNKAWEGTPPRYKVLYGILFAGIGFLAFAGLLSLGAARGLSRRLLG